MAASVHSSDSFLTSVKSSRKPAVCLLVAFTHRNLHGADEFSMKGEFQHEEYSLNRKNSETHVYSRVQFDLNCSPGIHLRFA